MENQIDKNFWLGCWKNNKLGFNQEKTNSSLIKFFPDLLLPNKASVFVPLCGKSIDMIWLLKQGLDVVGIELSPLAIQAFFKENDLPYKKTSLGPFKKWTANDQPITILEGDIFLFDTKYLKKIETMKNPFFHLIYDRASLIALPSDIRKKYYKLYEKLMNKESKSLLLTIEYEDKNFEGPPFSVIQEEIKNFLNNNFNVSLLNHEKVTPLSTRFLESCLEEISQKVYKIEKRKQN